MNECLFSARGDFLGSNKLKKIKTWIGLCLVVRFLHPFVWGARRGWWLRWSRAGGALAGAGEVASRRGRHVRDLSLPRLSLREVMRIRRPFSTRGRSVPRAPLLLLEVLVLPAIPAAAVLPALALVHGERINVIHHASITVRASHIHSLSQHHRSVTGAGTTI